MEKYAFVMETDANAEKKARESICKDCHFCGEFQPYEFAYKCNDPTILFATVFFERKGVFHTKIIQCNHFVPKHL